MSKFKKKLTSRFWRRFRFTDGNRFLGHARCLDPPDILDGERLSNLDRNTLAFDLFDVVGWNESVLSRSFAHMPPIIVGFV
jgi:hypothetical protein